MEISTFSDRHTLSTWNSDVLYIVRIIAAQIVLVGHLFSFLQLTPLKDETYFPYTQSLAVLVFFLLSGFLTDYSLQRKPASYSYFQYIKDHVIRIYGAYIPALLFIAVMDCWFISKSPDLYPHYGSFSLIGFAKNLFMIPPPFGSGRPLWTLFMEWWLYIAFGYLILVCLRKLSESKLNVLHLCVLALMLYVPFRRSNLMPLLAFLFGIVINRIYKCVKISNIYSLIITAVFFLIWSAYIKDAYHITETILISLIILQILAIGDKLESKLSKKRRLILQFLSGCTYPLYLTHYSIVEFAVYHFKEISPWMIFWSCIILANILSVVFYIAVKRLTDLVKQQSWFENDLSKHLHR